MTEEDNDSSPRIGEDPFDGSTIDWVRGQEADERVSLERLGDDPLLDDFLEDGLPIREDNDPVSGPLLGPVTLPSDVDEAAPGLLGIDQADGPSTSGPRAPRIALRSAIDGDQSSRPRVSIGQVLLAEDRRPGATFSFPSDFRWGVSVAGNSVEGFNLDSEWWAWEQESGHIKLGHTSGLACDWWKNAEADFDRAADLGVSALRLSVEWPRVEPGPNVFDDHVLQRYAAMLRALRERDIEPMVTFHHFSNPLWMAERGGWEQRGAIGLYSRYVRRAVEALADDCDLWCTFNDPNLYAYMAYGEGHFPPGKSDARAAIKVLRHMIEAHAAAYREIHSVQPDARVGLAHHYRPVAPADREAPEDVRTARRAHQTYNRAIVGSIWQGRWLSPLGVGPAPGLRRKLDWIGFSYYGRDLVQFDGRGRRAMLGRRLVSPGAEVLNGGLGEYYPQGLFECLQDLARMEIPIYVTENGIPDGEDDLRPRYLVAHLYEVWRALQRSYPIVGYYHRTLLDGFEWADGWTQRFGLLAFSPDSPARTPRRSAHLYSDIAHSGSINSELIDEYAPQLRGILLPEPVLEG
jgi:beta-glucosidase